mgnify:CR=1 FL=1
MTEAKLPGEEKTVDTRVTGADSAHSFSFCNPAISVSRSLRSVSKRMLRCRARCNVASASCGWPIFR